MKGYNSNAQRFMRLPALLGFTSLFAWGAVMADDTNFELKGDPEEGRSTYHCNA